MKKLILVLAVILVCLSCNADDDNYRSPNELEGTWNLISVSCECDPGIYESGDHLWNFNLSDSVLKVVNVVEDELQILTSGSYSFELDGDKITLGGVQYDFYFDDQLLYLGDMPESDGPLLQLSRE